jgi:tRNA threonylcarbamoyladenosine biosynthesis protein TsaE
MYTIITNNSEETVTLAHKIAGYLQGGQVIALNGDLGAGKTCFSQALGEKLRVTDNITSPTFVVMKVYDADFGSIKKFCHIDAYRLSSSDELMAIGALDYFQSPDTITAIEWAENIKKILPSGTILINITQLDNNQRKFEIENLTLPEAL